MPPNTSPARAVRERIRVRVRRFFASPDGKQQRVVGQLRAAVGVNRPLARVHRRKPVPDPPRPDVRHDPLHGITPNAGQTERLLHGERPIHEARIGAHKREPDPLARQPPDAQGTLDSGDPAPADYDLEW